MLLVALLDRRLARSKCRAGRPSSTRVWALAIDWRRPGRSGTSNAVDRRRCSAPTPSRDSSTRSPQRELDAGGRRDIELGALVAQCLIALVLLIAPSPQQAGARSGRRPSRRRSSRPASARPVAPGGDQRAQPDARTGAPAGRAAAQAQAELNGVRTQREATAILARTQDQVGQQLGRPERRPARRSAGGDERNAGRRTADALARPTRCSTKTPGHQRRAEGHSPLRPTSCRTCSARRSAAPCSARRTSGARIRRAPSALRRRGPSAGCGRSVAVAVGAVGGGRGAAASAIKAANGAGVAARDDPAAARPRGAAGFRRDL